MGDLREEQVDVIARALLASAIKGDLPQQRVLTRRLVELAPERWTKVRYNTAAFVVDDSFRAEVEGLLPDHAASCSLPAWREVPDRRIVSPTRWMPRAQTQDRAPRGRLMG